MNEQKLHNSLWRGWNTWDVRSVSTHVFLPDNAAIRFAAFDAPSRSHMNNFGWPEAERFGPHAVNGSYTCIDLRHAGHRFQIETAAQGEKFVAIVTPISKESFYLHVEALLLWGAQGTITAASRKIDINTARGRKHAITTSLPHSAPPGDPSVAPHIAFPMSGPAVICCNSRMNLAQARRFIADRREEYFRTESLTTEGDVGEGLRALQATVAWNTICDPATNRVMTPVSRMWARNSGGYVMFEWDTFFLGILASSYHKELAYANVLAMLGEMVPEGHVPNFASPNVVSRDRSEPPVGAYCVLKLWRQHRDEWFVRECFDRLVRWNRFWFAARDHDNTGLLEWGSDPYKPERPEPEWLAKNVGGRQGAMWESGLDNSPMWDDAKFNEEHHCLEMKDVGLNSLVALDCECLAELAAVLDEKKIEREMRTSGAKLKEKIETLWDSRSKMYLNRHWDGKFSRKLSPCHFYPLLAGIPDAERAAEMVEKTLLNTKLFWGKYVIPSISRNDRAYKDQQYWRGRIWGPMNFLVFEALRRYDGLADTADQLARKSLALLLKEWRENGHVHENYNAETGEGCDVKSSDPNYHWGALLAHLSLEQLVDVEPFAGGVRFGCGKKNAGSVKNVRLGEHTYAVSAVNGLEVSEDGQPLLHADKPVAIRRLRREENVLLFDVVAPQKTKLTVLGAADCEISAGKIKDRTAKGVLIALEQGTTTVSAT